MNILFIHQNFPAQYKHILNWLANDSGQLAEKHQIVFLTQKEEIPDVSTYNILRYKPDHVPPADVYPYSADFEKCCANGAKIADVCRNLEGQGFKPHIVIGHSGWGEMLFIKDLWPDVPVLSYFEYYYGVKGGAVGFDPEFPISDVMPFIMSARNAVNHLSHTGCDLGQTATKWQKNGYPKSFHDKIKVCHEGIRTDLCVPNPNARVNLGRVAKPVTRGDEVFTYMARNLEPVRGYHSFMRALPTILDARPNARVLIIGGKDVSYGRSLPDGHSYRGMLEQEVGDRIDWSRVHFLGRVPYEVYLAVIQLSRCHIYLTVPFVPSWSLMESMSMQATIVASDVAPVREIITDEKTGFLVDFFSPEEIAAKVIEVLAHKNHYAQIGKAARAHIVSKYDFHNVALKGNLRLMNRLLPKRLQLTR
ncbi:MAG: glycosyltransferase [Rhizobiales bacterium]|nr:glycosyltransferase [Hyphomicrobiales bacterium]